MASDNWNHCETFPADADLSANYREFMVLETAGDVSVAASQGELCIGILQNKPDAAGKAASVCTFGVCKVYAGATITIGQNLTAGADGRAEVAASADFVIGQARSAGADGEVITMFVNPDPVALA